MSISPVTTHIHVFPSILLALIFATKGLDGKITCANNGKLAVEDYKLVCICPEPFTGRLCEDFACVNGIATGDQYDPSSLFFNKRCLCDAGWTGELCDQSLFNRCGEHGREVKGKCICNPNFVGDRCEYVIKCTHGQLYNGRCSCHYGWAGDFCDKIICRQGEPDITNEQCICPSKFRGRYCDFCANPASSPPPECDETTDRRFLSVDNSNQQILVAVIIVILLIVLIALIFLLCHKSGRTNGEVKKARQAFVDIENSSPENGTETCPLWDGNQAANGELTAHCEKFHDAPPPYETLEHAQSENKVQIELSDSGNSRLTNVPGVSGKNAEEILGYSNEEKENCQSQNALAVMLQNQNISKEIAAEELEDDKGNEITDDQSSNDSVPQKCIFGTLRLSEYHASAEYPKVEAKINSKSDDFIDVPPSASGVTTHVQRQAREERPSLGYYSSEDTKKRSRTQKKEIFENVEAVLNTTEKHTKCKNNQEAIKQLRVRFSDEATQAAFDDLPLKETKTNPNCINFREHASEKNVEFYPMNEEPAATQFQKTREESQIEIESANTNTAFIVVAEKENRQAANSDSNEDSSIAAKNSRVVDSNETVSQCSHSRQKFIAQEILKHQSEEAKLCKDRFANSKINANKINAMTDVISTKEKGNA